MRPRITILISIFMRKTLYTIFLLLPKYFKLQTTFVSEEKYIIRCTMSMAEPTRCRLHMSRRASHSRGAPGLIM